MNTKLSLVKTVALVFAALWMVSVVLSLPGVTPVAQAGTDANFSASADLDSVWLAQTQPVTDTRLSKRGVTQGDSGAPTVASASPTLPASTYQVINNHASGPGSLRQAILDTNVTAGADAITFAANVSGTIVLTGSLPAIADTLTISGPGANVLAISGANAYGVFLINASTVVTITGLTIRDGNASSGGGINCAGSLVLNNTNILSNTAGYGGGVNQSGSGRADILNSLIEFNHSWNEGGGLYINGDVALTNTLVLTNTAGTDGGGLTDWAGRTDLAGGMFAGNSAGGNGGGVNANNSLSVNGTQFISNTAVNGGGLLQWNAGYTVTVTNARFERNHSGSNGGGLYVSGNATLTNMQVLSSTASKYGGGLYVNSGHADLIGGLFTNNVTSLSTSAGGGVCLNTASATLSGVQIFSNTAAGGGGVYVGTGGTAVVNGGQIFSNTATNGDGGGVLVWYGGMATVSATSILSSTSTLGSGGITSAGLLTVTNSLVSGNIGAFGGIENDGTLTLINSTVSGNQATSPSYGGGAVDQRPGSTSAIVNSTLISNTATTASRSGIWLQAGTLTLTIQNSMVAFNNGTNNVQVDGGTFNSLGYNLTNSNAGTPFTATTDLVNTNPLLGPLQNNGGSSGTYALLPGSPAIDRIPSGVNGCGASITTDQRGYARPMPANGSCDIGAYEVQFACRTQIGSGATFDSGDAAAVQAAVDAAPSGDTVKVAGTCAGVEQRAGVWQTVYIAKSLTMRGGYTLTNWTTSDPVATPTILDAKQGGRVVYLTGGNSVNVTLENLTVRGGSNGGVYSSFITATLNGMQIVSNTAFSGGGVGVNGGTITVTNSTVSGNTVSGWGGGLANYGGRLTFINSTFSGNQAQGSDVSYDGGGAIDLYGLNTTTIINSTIISNTANTAVITNAAKSGIWLESGTLNIWNSIVALNNGKNNVKVEGPATFVSQGYNLTNSGAGTPFTTTTDLINTNPLLGPLQNNGGVSWTYALLPGSSAIDRIPFSVNGCGTSITTDQRGWPRPFPSGGKCDIGAFESVFKIYLPLVLK